MPRDHLQTKAQSQAEYGHLASLLLLASVCDGSDHGALRTYSNISARGHHKLANRQPMNRALRTPTAAPVIQVCRISLGCPPHREATKIRKTRDLDSDHVYRCYDIGLQGRKCSLYTLLVLVYKKKLSPYSPNGRVPRSKGYIGLHKQE
ncbi:hypothetical protein FIBSPDRAFT_50998 [Athelia psychrophila]|uniref:Uncharacterized protein n=1 Tax=Athelia psychrophila TaxID=1759441 RepID=A0A166FG04_9AGAM|nr:hypothetical protein FIBSPDRAFT_50998 [Fibularhizoctonia sp. CBS 109695]